jgi:hypothetical protein
MARVTRSPDSRQNPNLRAEPAGKAEGNRKWLARLESPDGVKPDENGIILLGGSSLADFRLRVAQSQLRHDMMPSYWSHCGILLEGGTMVTVPLDLRPREQTRRREIDDVSLMPSCNGVRVCRLEEFDDPRWYPNIAVIRFAKTHKHVHDQIARVRLDRGIIDLPGLILPWLGFIWGVTDAANPLARGLGIPSAAFVETVFAMDGLELTPGLSSASSCPEAVWQSAKWWTGFYEKISAATESEHTMPMPPDGFYAVRQPAAAVYDPEDRQPKPPASKPPKGA